MIAAAQPIVLTKFWAGIIALALLVIPTAALHLRLARRLPDTADAALKRRRGLAGLVIGKDGRASTSRFGVVLWTYAVFFAMAFMLFYGKSWHCTDDNPRCSAAHDIREEISANFLNRDLQPAYFVLLGFPVAAALAAQGLASTRARENPGYKTPIEDDRRGLTEVTRELTGDDDGSTDLLDSQYLAFNVLMIGFFLLEFVGHPAAGLPDLPPTLLALSGVAASAYTTNKALAEPDEPDDENGGAPPPRKAAAAKKAAT